MRHRSLLPHSALPTPSPAATTLGPIHILDSQRIQTSIQGHYARGNPMKRKIDPLVDPVFKALFGSEKNKNLLQHFLNAVLAHPAKYATAQIHRLKAIELLDPHQLRQHATEKLTIVDVRARDQAGHLYQVEVQLLVSPTLPKRIFFTFCQMVGKQLKSGKNYHELKPVHAIWLLAENLIHGSEIWHHKIQLTDTESAFKLNVGSVIHILQLKNWDRRVDSELGRWLYFLTQGKNLNRHNLPDVMQTPEMRQAMGTLYHFTDEDHAYVAYERAENARRWEATLRYERDLAQKELADWLEKNAPDIAKAKAEAAEIRAQAEAEAEAIKAQARMGMTAMTEAKAESEKEAMEARALAAEAELERLRALLKAQDIDSK